MTTLDDPTSVALAMAWLNARGGAEGAADELARATEILARRRLALAAHAAGRDVSIATGAGTVRVLQDGTVFRPEPFAREVNR